MVKIEEWAGIGSAPLDGTKVLGWADGVFAVVEYNPKSIMPYWGLSVCGAHAEDGEWWPTHWLPLPKGPIALGEYRQPDPQLVQCLCGWFGDKNKDAAPGPEGSALCPVCWNGVECE